MPRDNKWLAQRLESIWKTHFADIAIQNEIIVRFGRRARTRLGSIQFGRRTPPAGGNPRTYITITGYFRQEVVPEYVVDAVLAHEFTHYTHGFHSPGEQLYSHPHKHGVVTKELTNRGLGGIVKKQKSWIKSNWTKFIRDYSRKISD
ncbi:hypothetical protein HYZ64_01450 [Candidatus Berkelbacteria bacterium]|nr:hypothetical protein [Candidatus Berkelbacteria bacterium]